MYYGNWKRTGDPFGSIIYDTSQKTAIWPFFDLYSLAGAYIIEK